MTTGAADPVQSARRRLGPVGVYSVAVKATAVPAEQAAVRRIEELGYGSIWTGEGIGGKDAFAHAGVILAATSRIVHGTGIANIWARHPATMQGGAATIGAGWPGRLVLGLGVSHGIVVDGSGQDYARPLSRMSSYLDEMDSARSMTPVPEAPVPRVLAALGPRMLDLARDQADGAHPYFVPPEHTPFARTRLGPDKLLIPEQAMVLTRDAADARRVARAHMAVYLTLPNYVNNLRRLGYDDDDLTGGGSDRLVDALVTWGDEQAIADRVAQLRASGADHVLLQPLTEARVDLPGVVSQLERMAPALLT